MTVGEPAVGPDDADTYIRSRRGLHGVAEILIAGPQYRRHGTIRLVVSERGFRGVALPIAVEGTDLVWPHGRAALAGPVAELAAAAGVDVGAPDGVYQSGAPLPVDGILNLDAQHVARVHHSLHVGAQALKSFAPDQQPVLWPEHFDVSVTVGGVNYGLSAGDSHHQWPYAYVGPPTTQSGAFWNAPFGALRALEPGNAASTVLDFFNQGREHLT